MSLCSYSQSDSVTLWEQLFHSVTEGPVDHFNFLKNVKMFPQKCIGLVLPLCKNDFCSARLGNKIKSL